MPSTAHDGSAPAARGRPRSTTHERVAHVALELFASKGFEETTVEDIAAALGVSRRTLFRYYASKNDIVWGDFDSVLIRLRDCFDALPADMPLMEALGAAVVESNAYPAEQRDELRIRMTLITRVPALQAHSMLRYAAWMDVVARWAAERTGGAPHDLFCRALAYAALGASTAAFVTWVDDPTADLEACLAEAYRLLATAFDAGPRR